MTDTIPRRALVLSGGGGRGAYHVGVLRFLEEHEWEPDVIVLPRPCFPSTSTPPFDWGGVAFF